MRRRASLPVGAGAWIMHRQLPRSALSVWRGRQGRVADGTRAPLGHYHPAMNRPGHRHAPPAAAPHGQERDAFELWLRQALRGAHDTVLREPVPGSLLALLEARDPGGEATPPRGAER